MKPQRTRLLAAGALLVALLVGACSKREPAATTATAEPAAAAAPFTVLAGSELKDLEPLMKTTAEAVGIQLRMSYAGTLDIVERINAGEPFDAILPPNGAYPALALAKPALAREKLFYSRVALGVKLSKAQQLGWDQKAPTWAVIAKAAGEGKLRYAMTNPASSNTGMSALFAVASAAAGKTEDLTVADVNARLLTAFLAGQRLTAGSSGWLAEAFAKDPAQLDAMVNYEAVILRMNEKLAAADRLTLIYPQDGVISADYPLMLLNAANETHFRKLVAAFKAPPFQAAAARSDYLRPATTDVPLAASLPVTPVVELSFPNRLEVIDAVLASHQSDWRRPATSIFVLDISGSMKGERLDAMRAALKVLAGADGQTASARYARFQRRERVVLLAFSDRVEAPVRVDFESQDLAASRAQVVAYADRLHVKGGTGIYAALLEAEAMAEKESAADANRFVSIVLLTDGENNVGPKLAEFRDKLGKPPARVFPILYGEASMAEMNALAEFTGGRVFDGRKAALAQVFKEIRGYQ